MCLSMKALDVIPSNLYINIFTYNIQKNDLFCVLK